jgi:hypothetical protein
MVGFSIIQIAPNCRGVCGFMRAGNQGKNLFRFSGRIDGRSLGAGTYRIRATTVQGQRTTSIKRETVVIVAPGRSVRSASAQRSTCGRGEEAAESRAAIAVFAAESGDPPTTGSTLDTGSPSGQSEASGQAGGENGAVVAPENSVRPADFLLQPRAPNLANDSDAGGGWSPLAFTAVGAMFIALLVIGGRELAERYRD